MNLVFVIAVGLMSIAMVLGGLVASRLLAPRVASAQKSQPYECGEAPIGPARIQFNVAYYLFALLFLVFDVEALFLYPWAVTLRESGMTGFIEILLFIFVLLTGLAYAYKKGALEWQS